MSCRQAYLLLLVGNVNGDALVVCEAGLVDGELDTVWCRGDGVGVEGELRHIGWYTFVYF